MEVSKTLAAGRFGRGDRRVNIYAYFKKKGIDTPDASFYRKIRVWKSWYKSNVRNFTFYKVYTGQGSYTRKKRKSLRMAKKLCEDMADLLLNERVKITLSDESTQEFVKQVLKGNSFEKLGNQYQEKKAYTGTVAYVPYLYDMVTDEEGRIYSGKIGINYYDGDAIYPVSWHNDTITECIFASAHMSNRKKYALLQFHKLVDGLYVIENTVLECFPGSSEGKELSPEEWKMIKPFKNLAPVVETGSDKPQFSIDKLNIVNNEDEDESNPMGVAIFANSIDILMKIDEEYDSYSNEFSLGKKRVFVSPEMLNYKNGSPAFDPDDTVFYKLPEDYNGDDGKGPIKELDMSLRVAEHSQAINDDLRFLSLKCGFGTEHYKFENGSVKTATEIISVNSDMYRTLQKHELVLDEALKTLIKIIIRLGNVIGENLNEDADITIDFDDSIIEDKQSERSQDRSDVSMGAMQLWEYRAKWYGETEEKAKAAVAQPAEVIE